MSELLARAYLTHRGRSLGAWNDALWTLQNDWVPATSSDGAHRLTVEEAGLLDDVRHFLVLLERD